MISGRAGSDVIVSSASFSPEPPSAPRRRPLGWAPHRPRTTRRCDHRCRRAHQDASRPGPPGRRRFPMSSTWPTYSAETTTRSVSRSAWSISPRISWCPPGVGTRARGNLLCYGMPGSGVDEFIEVGRRRLPDWAFSIGPATSMCSGSGPIATNTSPTSPMSVPSWRLTTASARCGSSGSCGASWREDAAVVRHRPGCCWSSTTTPGSERPSTATRTPNYSRWSPGSSPMVPLWESTSSPAGDRQCRYRFGWPGPWRHGSPSPLPTPWTSPPSASGCATSRRSPTGGRSTQAPG